jgi:DNA primase
VAVMEACSIREAALKLDDWFSSSTTTRPAEKGSDRNAQPVAENELGKTEAVGNTPLKFSLKGIDPTHKYFANRGITEETTRAFGAGFFPGRGSMSGRVVIPISNERGELVAYAGRAIDEAEPKYKLPSGFRKSDVLWNFDRVRGLSTVLEPVIVVEGFFDAMKIHQAGLPRVVSLMGSSLSVAQAALLCQFTRVVLCLDGDEAGRQATQAIASQLLPRTFVKAVHLADGLQPDRLSSEEIQAVLPKF